MNNLYVHENWKDQVSLQRALVGPFIECDSDLKDGDPMLLSRKELVEKIEKLEADLKVLKGDDRFEKKAPDGACVDFVDELVLDETMSEEKELEPDRVGALSSLKEAKKARGRVGRPSSRKCKFPSSHSESRKRMKEKGTTKVQPSSRRSSSRLKVKQANFKRKFVLEDSDASIDIAQSKSEDSCVRRSSRKKKKKHIHDA